MSETAEVFLGGLIGIVIGCLLLWFVIFPITDRWRRR